MKKKIKKLTLNRETLLNLDLADVTGGEDGTHQTRCVGCVKSEQGDCGDDPIT